jgi:hypothetical protein
MISRCARWCTGWPHANETPSPPRGTQASVSMICWDRTSRAMPPQGSYAFHASLHPVEVDEFFRGVAEAGATS